ncbi:putative polypeptide chain release factor methylase [Mesoplasma florum L1]|uniref:Polypeptide chain release factor methylase n=1 Tax=Mesoplasma florum (strain ATCC 33453 / NBRC 100688 / NCTC 11704 / L1) TaxID=265311 RepID=Q6F0I5_MESFL|nr:polypeptide chain release factor methylase [Mesoplasma florum]AAT75988.1 putative polypeptide chain release factor methylase [Mesoplasma florum L1]
MEKKIEFKSKFRLNFAIKDKVASVQEKNAHLYKVAIFSMFIFSVLMIPTYIFSWIVFSDINLKIYFDNWNALSEFLRLPSKFEILTPVYIGWGFFIATLIGFTLLKPFLTAAGVNNKFKTSFWIFVISFGIIAALMSSIAQYEFAKFQEFFTFESLIGQIDNQYVKSVPGVISEISKQFTANKDQAYKWASEDSIWWILFIQIIAIFMLSLSIQNAVIVEAESLNINKYIDYISNRKKELSQNRMKSFLAKIFKNSDKNISNWTMFAAACILLPQFVYVITISFDTTKTSILTRTVHVLPELLKRYGIDEGLSQTSFSEILKYEKNYFVYCSLPIIGLGTTMATFMYFISVSIRGENKSQNLFITQYFIIYANLVLITCLNIVSKVQVGNLVEAWNLQSENGVTAGNAFINAIKGIIGNDSDYEVIEKAYNLNLIDGHVGFLWEKTVNVIAESIILFGILISSFLIIGFNIMKTTIFKKRVGAQILFSEILAKRRKGNKNVK